MENEIIELDHEKAKLNDHADIYFYTRNQKSARCHVNPVFSSLRGKLFYQFQTYDTLTETSEFTGWFAVYP